MNDLDGAAIEIGLAAWRRGDPDALEQVLDPQATLNAVEPGLWDCASRGEVTALLRLRESTRPPDQPREVVVIRRDDATFLVSGLAAPMGPRPW